MKKIIFSIFLATSLLFAACNANNKPTVTTEPNVTSEIKNSPEIQSDEFTKNY